MPAPFPITSVTVHKISGRDLDAAITAATGHDFDPVADGAVGGDDSGGTLEVSVFPDPSGANYNLKAFEAFKTSGDAGSPRSVITGYLLGLADQTLIPYGNYQISYTWG
jgi:hypothetical protein